MARAGLEGRGSGRLFLDNYLRMARTATAFEDISSGLLWRDLAERKLTTLEIFSHLTESSRGDLNQY